MSDNAPLASSSSPPDIASSPPPPSSECPPDHVNLRVTYLLTGNPRPAHSLGRLPLDTTVSSLKDRIQAELPEHPPPQSQRLIYQGRPLLRNEASLREVLRLENGSAPGPLPYTIHIIIHSHAQQPTQPPRASTGFGQTASSSSLPAPLPARPIPAAQASATTLQDSLARIQQSIEANRADLRSVQQRIAMQHHNMVPPTAPHQTPIQPQNVHQHQHTGFPMPLHLPQLNAFPPNFIPGQVNLPAVHATLEQHRQHLQQHAQQHGLPGWPSIPPPPVHQPHTQYQQHGNTPPHAQPPNLPSNPQIRSVQGPNGERVTLVTDHMNMRIPVQRPASAPGQTPSVATHNSSTRRPLTPNAGQEVTPAAPHNSRPVQTSTATLQEPLPQQAALPFHLPLPFSQARMTAAMPSSATAWVLSSPTGPQALLFTPNHGYFSSANTVAQLHQSAPQLDNDHMPTDPSSQSTSNVNPSATQVPAGPARHGAADVNDGLLRQGQRLRPAALAQVQQNREDNDLFAFLIQRGWLFLRLYLFMFVFSEQGTWKRWLMIILATVICLQPRNGPLTRALTAARQHFDHLIGPPAPNPQPTAHLGRRQRDRDLGTGATRADAGRASPRPANVRGALQMTPEEAAARLVREHETQNLSFWRNVFHRLEQGAALFLASLVPGVGERHVRAREEARRIAQQLEEEERRQADNEGGAATHPNESVHAKSETSSASGTAAIEVDSDRSAEPGTSSGIQIGSGTDDAGDLRNRAAATS